MLQVVCVHQQFSHKLLRVYIAERDHSPPHVLWADACWGSFLTIISTEAYAFVLNEDLLCDWDFVWFILYCAWSKENVLPFLLTKKPSYCSLWLAPLHLCTYIQYLDMLLFANKVKNLDFGTWSSRELSTFDPFKIISLWFFPHNKHAFA